jgi:hypothetical protein
MFTSGFTWVTEDSSTGHYGISGQPDEVLHDNSLMFYGPRPPASSIEDSIWARPDYAQNGGFNHEFEHMVGGATGAINEIFSSGAEALAGHLPIEPIRFEAPYTWPLHAYSSLDCERLDSTVGLNYQAYRLFSAYLLYHYRGTDLDPVLPDPQVPSDTSGFADDVFYRWAHSDSTTLYYVGRLLLDDVCADCSAQRRPYFHPGGVPLDRNRRLELLLHHWRVANYVNSPALDQGQYGYPSQFGFSPRLDVGCWQTIIDSSAACPPASDDGISIPPEVTLTAAQAVRETTFVEQRTWADGEYSYPMQLLPLGAEYWIVRSTPELAALDGDLVVRVTPETIDREDSETLLCQELTSQRPLRDSHLLASVVGYSEHQGRG